MSLTQEQIRRYARHLPLMGIDGQERLLKAKVLCIGAGGLGAPVLQYLAAVGVGTLGIVDGDRVELSNLQRQVIFTVEDIGKSKAQQAGSHLHDGNPNLNLRVYEVFLDRVNADKIIPEYDIIVDCTDNYRARYLINDLSVRFNKPLISASIYQFQGQVSVFNNKNGPCYRCLYASPPPDDMAPNCALGGVLGVLPGLLGCIQATEVIKILLEQGDVLSGRLLTLDALSMKTKEFNIMKDPDCPCCHRGESAEHLFEIKSQKIEAPKINSKTLQMKLNDERLYLLDVREHYERNICHIGGKHIPLGELERHLDELPKNRMIVCYCKSGQRSQRAANLLSQNGFIQVASLQGGILAWMEEVDGSLMRY